MLGLKRKTNKKSHENTNKTTYLCDLYYGLIAKVISSRAQNIPSFPHCANESGTYL